MKPDYRLVYNELLLGKTAWEELTKILLPEDQHKMQEQFNAIEKLGAQKAYESYAFEGKLPPDVCKALYLAFHRIEFEIMCSYFN